MSVKFTGKEFKSFYNEDWGQYFDNRECWVEGDFLTINGKEEDDPDIEAINDEDIVTLSDGVIVFADDPSHDTDVSLESFARKWKKKQTTVSFLVECDVSKLEQIKLAIKNAGGKVK